MSIHLPLFQDNHILPTGKYHISFSEANTCNGPDGCGWRHKLKYVDGHTEPDTEHTLYGKAIHSILQKWVLHGKTKEFILEDEINNCYNKVVNELGTLPHFQPSANALMNEWLDPIDIILRRVPSWMDETFPGWKPVASEVMLFEPIAGQTKKWFKGFIDCVIKVPKEAPKGKKKTTPASDIYWIIDWKGQRLTAPILTPSGWTTMGNLKLGQQVVGSNGKPTRVVGIFPLGKRDVYRVSFRDGTVVDTTDDHLWSVKRSDGFSKVMTSKELIAEKKHVYVPVMTAPVEYGQYSVLPVHPYVLGILLGDGTLDGQIRLKTTDPEILESIKTLMPDTWSFGNVTQTPTCGLKGAIKDIRTLGLAGKRTIPEIYLKANPTDRLSLVQGLLDTAGGWVQKGVVKFCTTSKLLAEGLKALIQSLGGVGFLTKRKKFQGPTELTEYTVAVKLPSHMAPFRLAKKRSKVNLSPSQGLVRRISKVEKLDEQDHMQCIKVDAPDSLYVTNDYILTHNTTSWGWNRQKREHKKMQLVLYQHYFSLKTGIPLENIRCGFVLLKRTAKREKCELVEVSVGDKSRKDALDKVSLAINLISKRYWLKNRNSCRYCEFNGTSLCT